MNHGPSRSGTPAVSKPARRYDNSARRARAALTRRRIVEAGAELLRRSPIRKWDEVTIGSVARHAGVHERTVYRHFGNEKALRDAVMAHLEESAGVDLTSLRLEELSGVAATVLRFASAFPSEPATPLDPTLDDADQRRRDALINAVSRSAAGWDSSERVRAAAVLDLLWNFSSFERLRDGWGLSDDEAIDVIRWGVDLVTQAAPTDTGTRNGNRTGVDG